MPQLHVPTLLIALPAGLLLLTLALGLAQPELRARAELRRWVQGSWAVLAGWALLALRPVLPDGFSFVAGHGLLGMGLALYHRALQRLWQAPAAPRPSGWWLVAWWLALLGLHAWPLPWRTAAVSLALAAALLPIAWVPWRAGRAQRSPSTRTVLAAALLGMGALVLRAGHAALAPDPYPVAWPPGTVDGLLLAVAQLALVGGGIGFVLATVERLTGELAARASHDGLTGCVNRPTTDALLAHALARARREGSPLAFALLDLDGFKQLNEQHGHRAGDEVLRRFAEAARGRLRHADVIGRTGGGEFGLVLPATDLAGARRLVEDVRQAAMALALQDADGRPIRVTLSAGIAVLAPDEALSADRLYGRADQALYEAKCGGRNRAVCYGDSNPRQGVLIA